MKKNKIYRGYHHEDLTLKFLKENTTKYIAKITGAEFCDEINVELINLKPKVLRIDYGIKKKDKIILYEFLSTKSNIANILRRIFLYVARIGYDYLKITSANVFDSNVYSLKTKILMILNNFEEALAVIDEGLKISPDDDSIYATKAMILLRAHKYGEGIECVNKALELNPSNVIALKLRNNVLKGNLR